MKATRYLTAVFAGAFLLVAAPVSGQIDDARWLPFVGCWEPADEAEDAGLLCFRPAEGGVEMTSVVAGEIVATEQLVSDGQPRPIVAEGCEGTESVSFSQDGRRVFTRSDIVCGDDSRPGTGVMAIITPNGWVDVRALDVQGETVAWVQIYRLVGPERMAEAGIDDPQLGMEGLIGSSRMVAAREIDVDDVTEAADEIDTEAVTAWIAAQSDHFDLTGDDLVRMADSGVPEQIIDVMVAVSYPDYFNVGAEQRVAQADDQEFTGRRIPVSVGYRSYMMWDPFYSGYGSFGYSPFGYNRFGYGYGGYGYGFGGIYNRYGVGGYGYGPTIIRIDRRRVSDSNGRVVNGRGWTRSSGSSGGTAVRRGGGSSSGGGYTGSSSSGGSRGAARSGGRRAKPRGGG